MPRKQTRRSVNVKSDVYRVLADAADTRGVAMSQLLTELIEQKTPPAPTVIAS